MRPVVLFVDDEPNLLSGLRRITHSFKNEWDIHFAEGGEAALAMIDDLPINTLVTDMRMPGMDGAALLERVSRTHPGIFRIALSGESNVEQAMRITGRSHRFLGKPTEPSVLYRAIQRIFDVGSPLFDKIYNRDVSLLDRLKATYGRQEELELACSLEENAMLVATATIMSDPNLSIRTLQLTNSAYFGAAVETVSIASAVQYLGIERLRELLKRHRLGKEHSGNSATGRDNLMRAQAALFAHDIGTKKRLTNRDLDLAYAIALFSALGVDAKRDHREVACLPASIAALTGMPDQLVRGLGLIGLNGAHLSDPRAIGVLAVDIALEARGFSWEAA